MSPAKSLPLLLGATIASFWAASWWLVPTDRDMGEVYRIIYVHVPSASAAFATSLFLLVQSLIALRNKSELALLKAKSVAQVGLLFTVFTLITGSIWGYPTWGTWWTWDARLTTTLVLALLYAGYLLLYETSEPGEGRLRSCGVLGIMIFIDVPIIYKSVTWWRTLHQPPSIIRAGGSTMDPLMLKLLLVQVALMIVVSLYMIQSRYKVLALAQDLDEQMRSPSQSRGRS